MTRWSVFVVACLFLSVALAGCLESDGPDEEPVQEEEGQGAQGGRQIDLEKLEGGEPEEWEPSLDEAPEWRLGQWWRVRVVNGFDGTVIETTVVVAGAERDWYLTGMPENDFSHGLMVLHVPPVGQIGKGDLAWDVHDTMFHPVQFPLREGDTWDTHWAGAPIQADVIDVSGLQAEVEFIGDNQHFTVVYDAELGTIRSLEMPGYASVEVVEHGYGFEGVVTVPHEHELVFFHGRLAGAMGVGFQNMEPHPPLDTITVGGDYDRVSFALIMFALAPGYFAVDVTAPDGTSYTADLVATQENEAAIVIHSNDSPVGEWEASYVATTGVAFIEGIGYHVFDIDLPSGCILGEMDEHAHHGDEDHPEAC